MSNFDVDISEIVDFIIDELSASRMELSRINNAIFHHNTSYQNAPLVCEHGILTLLDLNKIGIRNDSLDLLEKFNDIESHINGNDGVSLAKVGLNDLYDGETEYDPFDPSKVDFTLSGDVKAYRNSSHYGNEYICSKSIETKDILTIDIRIREYIDKCVHKGDLIDMYNNLIDVAKIINENNLDISLREMSYDDNFSFDISKLALSKKIEFSEN